MKHFFPCACGRATLLTIFVFLLLPIGSALAQELIPDSIYFYYGRQMTLEEVNHIASERFSRTGAYTDCVYVPSSDDSPSRADYNQVFECFDTPQEAHDFSLQLRANDARYTTPSTNATNFETFTSCDHWAIYSQSFHVSSSWVEDICVGQTIWTSSGIWSLWDAANNEVRLSDNPSYLGQRWTFGWTQYTLSAGPGGSRHAYHCTTAIC